MQPILLSRQYYGRNFNTVGGADGDGFGEQPLPSFQRMINKPLTPLPEKRNNVIQHLFRALNSDDILAVYHDQDESLKSIFDRYCKASDRAGAPEALGVLLNIAEFRMILRDSGLLGGNNKVSRLSQPPTIRTTLYETAPPDQSSKLDYPTSTSRRRVSVPGRSALERPRRKPSENVPFGFGILLVAP